MIVDRPLILLLAIAVGVLSVARVVRLIVDDTYPPVLKVKEWWVDRASVQWLPLVECPFCVAPYVALPAVAWGATVIRWPTNDWNLWIWWLVNGWAALSYVAAMVTVRDIPKEDRE